MPRNSKVSRKPTVRLSADEILIFEGLISALAGCSKDARLETLLIAYAEKAKAHATAANELAESIATICSLRKSSRNRHERRAIVNAYDAAERVFAGRPKLRVSA